MIFIIFHCVQSAYLNSKSIEVTVNSSFLETTPFEESINFFNEFYPAGYSCISQTINSLSGIPTSLNETLSVLSKCVNSFQLNFISYLLKYHYFSPRVAFYTSISKLKKNDHVSYPFEPRLNCHQYVDFTKKNIKIDQSCVIRPIISNPELRNTQILNGYGVELRPFRYSMEYGVKDSMKIYNSTISKFEDGTRHFIDQEVNLTSTFKEPSPRRLRRALFSFIDELKNGDDEEKSNDSLLSSLRDISSNWPAALSHVGSTEIDKDVEDEENDDSNSFDIPPGSNSVTLNGRVIPISTFDPFTFASAINEELNLIQALGNDLFVPQPTIELLTKMTLTKPTLSVDIRKLPVKWLNDIEKDKKYKKWTSKLKPLFGALKSLPKIRKNLINIVLIIDPSFPKDFKALIAAFNLVKRGYPVRLGVLLSPHITSEKSTRVFCGIEEVEQKFTLTQLLNIVDLNETDPEKAFSDAYENLTSQKWEEIDFKDSTKLSHINEILKKLNETGIAAPSLWVNGALSSGSEIFDYMEVNAFEALKKLREVVPPTFEGDILDLVLQRSKSVTKIVPEIHSNSPVPIKITQYSYSELSAFTSFLKKSEYELEDKEFPLATMWVVCSQNKKETIKEKVTKFFKEEHKTPVRIAFFDQIPIEIKIDPHFPQISTSNFDAILIVNGRLILINEDFDGYGQFCDWMATPEIADIARKVSFTQKFDESESNLARKNLHTFWSIALLSYDYFDVKRRHFHPNTFDPDSPAVITTNIQELPLNIEAVLDPFSHEFQKMIGFFASIENLNIADISIRLNPPDKLTKVPSSFYRYVTDKAGVFSFLNESVTYSVLIEAPETWLVEQIVADVDLDNILGGELEDGTFRATYVLKNIIVEGSAIDLNNSHCSGAQLILLPHTITDSSKSLTDNIITDTIVMKNKGYWQLKANAGLYIVKSTNYEMLSETENLVVASFVWRQNLLKLRKPQKEQSADVAIDAVDDGKIHIFVVASGHLYERLAKIMMLSAMNHAEGATCKFWFFQNFLSPQFKNTLEMMKGLYPMEYQLVTYRWPYWLRRQTEKQRITWGNKILFLDVLFPLSLKRVIYVDADQTIRTNMRELMTMDFGDAPYAFTPFCNSRSETEPYRFWKSGYWKEQLKGKPYHISALFAIDLKKFREIAAGDWLRYYYATLAGDANSLANLDQDLPNYAQERIPIFSLPQEWLWCETWCSDDTMNEAKTIDLCNNPLTKRPKLEIAQTRIEEWPKLDEEARSIEIRAMKAKPDKKERIKNDDL